MTQISRDDVTKLATLSNLHMSDAEIEHMYTDLHTILEYVEQLNELDTNGVEPAYQVSGQQNVWREDIVKDSATEDLLALAPDRSGSQIKVPKVL